MKINEWDRAEIKHQAREMYNDLGYEGTLDCLMECLVFVECVSEVILEEWEKNYGKR